MTVETIEALFEQEIKDIYDAEKQLVRTLPKVAKAATAEELRTALEEHLDVTREHVRRLEEVFELAGMKVKGKPCEAMKGLVAEGHEAINQEGDDALRDVALIGAAKRVEHYEIAAYQSAISLAEALGYEEASDLLNRTLGEEEEADTKLGSLCEQFLTDWKTEAESAPEAVVTQLARKTRRAAE
jgi:ferritin-like metal-binding protein YciE